MKKTNSNKSVFDNGLGKLPPQALDLEEAVLGACMLEKNTFLNLKEILTSEDFYMDKNATIFRAMDRLHKQSAPIDILTVTNELKSTNELDLVGGPFGITQMTNRVASAANIAFHAKIIKQKSIHRTVIRTSTELAQNAWDESIDPFELLSATQKQLDVLLQHIITGKEVTFRDQVIETYASIEKVRNAGKPIFGMPTGFPIKDMITAGRAPGTLTIVAARPSMGKTTYMLQEIKNVAMSKRPIGVFSLESKSKQFIIKLLSNLTSIDNRIIKNGQYDLNQMEEIARAAEILASLGIYLKDNPAVHIDHIITQAKIWKKKFNIEALYIDYIQLVVGEKPQFGGNRDLELGSVSRGLKTIAMELDIPVIALAQLSRKVDERKPKPIPLLADIRESGNIEQDADVVEFLYRPDYYDPEAMDVHNNSLKGLVQVIIAKNRDGALDNTFVRFLKEYSSMLEIDTMNKHESDFSNSDSKITHSRNMNGFTVDPDGDMPF